MSSVFGACGLLLGGVAVSTDYWLLMEEGIVLQQNQTTEVKMALHSGLGGVCFVAGKEEKEEVGVGWWKRRRKRWGWDGGRWKRRRKWWG